MSIVLSDGKFLPNVLDMTTDEFIEELDARGRYFNTEYDDDTLSEIQEDSSVGSDFEKMMAGAAIEYISMAQESDPDYNIDRWIEDTEDNYPGMLESY